MAISVSPLVGNTSGEIACSLGSSEEMISQLEGGQGWYCSRPPSRTDRSVKCVLTAAPPRAEGADVLFTTDLTTQM